MDFNDTLEKRLSDPEFRRELIAELREVMAENERMRRALKAVAKAAVDGLMKGATNAS